MAVFNPIGACVPLLKSEHAGHISFINETTAMQSNIHPICKNIQRDAQYEINKSKPKDSFYG